MHLRAAQQSLAMIGIKRDKKQGRVVLLEDEIQTWRVSGICNNGVVEALVPSACLSVRRLAQAPLQRTDPYNTTRKRR